VGQGGPAPVRDGGAQSVDHRWQRRQVRVVQRLVADRAGHVAAATRAAAHGRPSQPPGWSTPCIHGVLGRSGRWGRRQRGLQLFNGSATVQSIPPFTYNEHVQILNTPHWGESLAIASDRWLEAASERLQEFGITLKIESRTAPGPIPRTDAGFDAIVTLSRAGSRARYAVAARDPMTLSSIVREALAKPSHPLLVIGDRVSRRSAAALRDAGIQFIDSLGNAFITFGDVLVEVQGRTGPADHVPETDHGATQPQQLTNMFSARRSQIILALLSWPELSTGTVRGIAEAAGVSAGLAHDTLVQLEKAAFIAPRSRRLDRTDELLDYWTATYPSGLSRQLEIARYHGDPSRPISRPHAEQPIYLSGESARGTDIARPATLTVYLDSLDPKLPLLNRWTSNPDRPSNVFIRQKFWTSPRPQEERSTDEQNAPWPLVYADLVAVGDARLREAARAWRSRHARSTEI
jgi:hypothetical protein